MLSLKPTPGHDRKKMYSKAIAYNKMILILWALMGDLMANSIMFYGFVFDCFVLDCFQVL